MGAQEWQYPSLPRLQSSHQLAQGSQQEVKAFPLRFPRGPGGKREEQVGWMGTMAATTAHLSPNAAVGESQPSRHRRLDF